MNIKVTERLYDEPRPGTPRTIPDDLDIHLIMDNYATHKTPAIRNWLSHAFSVNRVLKTMDIEVRER